MDKLNDDILIYSANDDKDKFPSKDLENGCYDLYANINHNQEPYFIIPPHSNRLVPTGVHSAFDDKYRISIRERGSNTKSELMVMAGQIDSGYRGEWFVSLYNTTEKYIVLQEKDFTAYDLDNIVSIIINKYKVNIDYTDLKYVSTQKAICQFAVEEVPRVKIKSVELNQINDIPSKRGEGKLGSSGK